MVMLKAMILDGLVELSSYAYMVALLCYAYYAYMVASAMPTWLHLLCLHLVAGLDGTFSL